tara:strand:- start:239 stop:361 length:123 start_codon:yes stop_codon:yes gene_type:complete
VEVVLDLTKTLPALVLQVQPVDQEVAVDLELQDLVQVLQL